MKAGSFLLLLFLCQSMLTVCTIIKFGVNMGNRGQAWPKLLLISGLILSDRLHLNYMFKTNTALSFFSWLKMVNEWWGGGGVSTSSNYSFFGCVCVF